MYDTSKKVLKSIMLIVFLLAVTNCSQENNELKWTAINVCNGIQGDAHLVYKGDKYYLIDTGEHKQAVNHLLPYLKSIGVKELEGIIITHPHFDHYGGTVTLLQSDIKIKHIYMNMPTEKQMQKEWWGGKYQHLLQIQDVAKVKHVLISSIKQGDFYRFDDKSYIEVLYAYNGIDTPVGQTDINDMSAIMMIHDDKNRFLLAGDLNKKLGHYLADHAKNIKADILKAPHHGAEKFAPNDFFEKVSPKALIVPAQKSLWCSKRSKRTRELSKKYHYTTYINGFHGHITVHSYNNQYNITTEKKPKNICKEE